jgi:signal transduction histidine kinase
MFFGFALARVIDVTAGSARGARVEAVALIVALASAFALIGNARELALAYMRQRAQRFDAEVNAELADARFRSERAAREEQLHDARSAIVAIQAATRALERNVDMLSSSERALLTSAIDAELARAREIISTNPASQRSQPFSVRDALLPLVTCQRALGRPVHADLPQGLRALGRPAAAVEVVQNLIDNAALHAPGSPITLRAVDAEACVHIRVEDHGPGVPRDARRAIFERGVATPETTGGGLGLFVAHRLAQEDGGTLWVEDMPGGGAAFVLCLLSGSVATGSPISAAVGRAWGAERVDHASDPRNVVYLDHEDLVEGS